MNATAFHAALMATKNKGEMIGVFRRFCSERGYFSDQPEGLFAKLEHYEGNAGVQSAGGTDGSDDDTGTECRICPE